MAAAVLFDSNAIIAGVDERGAKTATAQHPRRTKLLPVGAEIYKWHHLIEDFFCQLKEFKRIAPAPRRRGAAGLCRRAGCRGTPGYADERCAVRLLEGSVTYVEPPSDLEEDLCLTCSATPASEILLDA